MTPYSDNIYPPRLYLHFPANKAVILFANQRNIDYICKKYINAISEYS